MWKTSWDAAMFDREMIQLWSMIDSHINLHFILSLSCHFELSVHWFLIQQFVDVDGLYQLFLSIHILFHCSIASRRTDKRRDISLKISSQKHFCLRDFYYDWVNSDNSQIHDTVQSTITQNELHRSTFTSHLIDFLWLASFAQFWSSLVFVRGKRRKRKRESWLQEDWSLWRTSNKKILFYDF